MIQPPPAQGFGMNQMLELFKMQFLMKSLSGEGGQGQGNRLTPIYTMIFMMLYDNLSKHFPHITSLILLWFNNLFSQYTNKPRVQALFDQPTPQPSPEKKARAFIQFERVPDAKVSDPRIDAVIYHVCNLPEVKSLRFNGQEMVPNFTDMLMIENDIWFEIVNPSTSSQSPLLFTSNSGGNDMKLEAIVYKLTTFDHDIKWLHRFVEQAIELYEQEKKNKLGSESYYFDHVVASGDAFRNPLTKSMIWFSKSKFSSNRTLKNVYLRQCEELQKRVEFFQKRRDWYDSKGIPHTLGIVMWGHPGCGKTSTIKAIANDTKRHIFNIMLSEIKTKEALKNLFYNDTVPIFGGERLETYHIPINKRIYVIEDIDAMDSIVLKRTPEQIKKEEEKRLKREAEMELLKQQQGQEIYNRMVQGTDDKTDALDLATLLNVLDGVRETPGRIIILSTNYPERLDEALLRPGRFDMMIEYEKHPIEILKEHLQKYYDTTLTVNQDRLLSNPALDKKWTPAEVSQILFKFLYSIDDAIDCLVRENPESYFRFSRRLKGEAEGEKEKEGTLLENLLVEVPIIKSESSDSLSSLETELPEKKEEAVEAVEEKEAKEKNAVFLKESDEILKKTGVETIATPRYDMTEDIETLLKTFLQHEEEFSEGFVKAFEPEDGPVSLEDAFSQAPILGF
jgi:hypothetical protein